MPACTAVLFIRSAALQELRSRKKPQANIPVVRLQSQRTTGRERKLTAHSAGAAGWHDPCHSACLSLHGCAKPAVGSRELLCAGTFSLIELHLCQTWGSYCGTGGERGRNWLNSLTTFSAPLSRSVFPSIPYWATESRDSYFLILSLLWHCFKLCLTLPYGWPEGRVCYVKQH